MSKKILLGILVVSIVVGMVGVGTYALWSDSVTSSGNSFTAGTLRLKVGDTDPFTPQDIKGMMPGFDGGPVPFALENTGDVHGDVTLSITNMLPASGIVARNIAVKVQRFDGATVFNGNLSDFGSVALGHLEPGSANKSTAHIRYSVPTSAGNDIQGLRTSFDVTFRIDQTP